MKKLILFLLSTCLFQLSFAQNDPVLAIDGVNTTFKSGLSLPYWLKEGQTINIVNNVKSVSILEFIVAGNNLKFSQVISLTGAQTVPIGKAWKIEGLGIGVNGVNTSFSSSTLPTIYTSPKVFDYPGIFQWTVPPGVTNICVEVWGAGGSGSTTNYSLLAGGGGGYGYQCFSVTPGAQYTVVVSGGGGASSLGNFISATDGANADAGGNGGTSTATYSITGEQGQNIYGWTNGRGGNGANGGSGGKFIPNYTYAGSYSSSLQFNYSSAEAPGGGGYYGNSYSGFQYPGAPGRVIIYW